MNRLTALTVLLAATIAFAGPTEAAEPHGISCRLTGVLTFKPALSVEPQETKISFRGHMTYCVTTTDIRSGDLTGAATAEGGCTYGDTEGVIHVKWDDGSTTAMPFTATSATAFAALSGTAGKSTSEAVHEGDPIGGFLSIDADPARCVSGIKTAQFQGQGFGGAP